MGRTLNTGLGEANPLMKVTGAGYPLSGALPVCMRVHVCVGRGVSVRRGDVGLCMHVRLACPPRTYPVVSSRNAQFTVMCVGCQRDRAETIIGTEEFKSQRWDSPFLADLVRGGFSEELEKLGLGRGSGRGE